MQRESTAPLAKARRGSLIARLARRSLQPLLLTWGGIGAAVGHADGHTGLSWNYVDADYASQEVDLVDENDEVFSEDVHGSNFEGSLMFADNWMIQATYGTDRLSFDGFVLHTEALSAGAAYRFPFAGNFDVLVGGGYAYARTDGDAVVDGDRFRLRESSQGVYLDGRLRGRFAQRFEAEAYLSGVYFEDDFYDEDVVYGVKGRFYITPRLALSIGAFDSKESDEPWFTLGLRLQGKGIRG